MSKSWFVPEYNHLRFCDVWGSLANFLTDYNENIAFFYKNTSPLTANAAKTLYFLLYAKYGNTPIINNDVNQWKYKVFANIYAKGPTWEKKMDIQTALNNLSQDDIMRGAKQVYNHAFNPSATPSTDTLTELTYINDQNTANHKKGIVEAYSLIWQNLHASATEEFINSFKNCFSVFVGSDVCVPFYITDEDNIFMEGV